MTMYLLYYADIGTVKKRERRKRSNNVLVKLCSHRYCKERKKGRNERDHVLVISCRHRTVNKEKGENDRTISLLYYAAIGTIEREEKREKRT